QKYPSKAKTGGLTNTKPKRKGAEPKMNFDTAPLRSSIVPNMSVGIGCRNSSPLVIPSKIGIIFSRAGNGRIAVRVLAKTRA
ncbi:hypothetical protein, partial [Porphyromonas gulae]|uniref:hypothetical protein n=1 Tax=Porphyromonas gulae TaxID=111105 RepID=UPI001F3721AF